MRNFDYTKAAIKCIDNEIVNMLIEIYKRNERLNFVFGSGKYDFSDFARQAQLESVISTNRMEYAHFNENSVERILQDKNLVLSQEIEICGYNDALVFTKAFHSVRGMSPSAYRKASQQESSRKQLAEVEKRLPSNEKLAFIEADPYLLAKYAYYQRVLLLFTNCR